MRKFVSVLLFSAVLTVALGVNIASASVNYYTAIPVGMGSYSSWGGIFNGMNYFGSNQALLVDESSQNGNFDYVYSSTTGAKTSFYMELQDYSGNGGVLNYAGISMWAKRGTYNESTAIKVKYRTCVVRCYYPSYWTEVDGGTYYLTNDWAQYNIHFYPGVIWGVGYEQYYQVVFENVTGHPRITMVRGSYVLQE